MFAITSFSRAFTAFLLTTGSLLPLSIHGQVPHTFSPGSPISASEMNANFSAVMNDIASATSATFGPEWFLQPSADGASRNVLVFAEEYSGDNDPSQGLIGNEKFYRVEVFYTNDSYSYDFNGTTYTPDEVRIWAQVFADRDDENGNPQEPLGFTSYYYFLSGRTNNPQAVNAFAYADHALIETDFDLTDDSVSFSGLYAYEETNARSVLSESTLVDSIEIYRNQNNEVLTAAIYSGAVTGPIDPIYVPTIDQTYNDVIIQSYPGYGGGGRVTFLAKNIGPVLVMENDNPANDPSFNSQLKYELIYSRINGTETGSLTNTPFDPDYEGENFKNKFFNAAPGP